MNVTTLRTSKAVAMTTPAAPTAAQAVNALWLRLDQARNVALCIPDKCDGIWQDAGAVAALGQVMALAGAVSELLALALNDTQALEALV
jgi:hypothetical protein